MYPIPFYDRKRELALLNHLYARPAEQMCELYDRMTAINLAEQPVVSVLR